MKNHSLFLGLIALITALTAMAVEPAIVATRNTNTITLENSVLRMEIRSTPAPFVEKLVHKASGLALIASPADKNLFSINFTKQDGSKMEIGSSLAAESDMRLEGNKLMLQYRKFPGAELSVEVTATFEKDNPLTFWSIHIKNKTGRPIKAVQFPQIVTVPAIGEAKDDVLVLPSCAGTLIENPATNLPNGYVLKLEYPGNLSAQFIAYQNRAAGLYLAGTDTAGHPMELTVVKQPKGCRIYHKFTPVTDTADWQSPYAVAVGVTQGAWYDTADQYKQWATRQNWCAKKLVERTDIPEWLKAGPDVHVCEVRTYDNHRAGNGSFYPQLHNYLRAYRDKIDGPVVAMLGGWENHRRWTGGDYFPVFDAENAKPVIAQLRQDGFRPFFYLSGGFYTFLNSGRDGGEIPAAQKYMMAYVRDEKTGKPKEYTLNESSGTDEWKRHSYAFCVGTPQTEAFFCDVIDQAHQLGVDMLQMDQVVEGAGDACYATTHGHAPGVGLYQSHDYWNLLDTMRKHGKTLAPDFALLNEEEHEQLIPHLDGFHVREYYEKRWYRGYPGAVGIPLFDYLYHEFALGYGGDSAMLSKENSRWNIRCHAINLITGRTPGGSVWSAQKNMYEAHPDQITMLRNHCRLLKTRAKDFLMLGRMLHPLELDSEKLTFPIPVKHGSQTTQEEISRPAILTSSWEASDGKIGHLFVNIAGIPQPLKVNLDTRNAPAMKTGTAEIYRSTSEKFKPLWQHAPLPREFATQLEPLEAVFIELQTEGK